MLLQDLRITRRIMGFTSQEIQEQSDRDLFVYRSLQNNVCVKKYVLSSSNANITFPETFIFFKLAFAKLKCSQHFYSVYWTYFLMKYHSSPGCTTITETLCIDRGGRGLLEGDEEPGGRGPSQAVSSVLSICIVSSMSLHWTTILPMHRVTKIYV